MLKHLYLNNFHVFSYSMLIKDYVFALRAHWYGLELIFFMTLDGRKHFEPVKSAWSFYSELKASVLHPVEGNNNGIRTNTHREKVEEGDYNFQYVKWTHAQENLLLCHSFSYFSAYMLPKSKDWIG